MDSLDDEALDYLVDQAFGHPARLRIIHALLPEEFGLRLTVLKARTGLTGSTLERHARALADAGIVAVNVPLEDARQGIPLEYSLNRPVYSQVFERLVAQMRP